MTSDRTAPARLLAERHRQTLQAGNPSSLHARGNPRAARAAIGANGDHPHSEHHRARSARSAGDDGVSPQLALPRRLSRQRPDLECGESVWRDGSSRDPSRRKDQACIEARFIPRSRLRSRADRRRGATMLGRGPLFRRAAHPLGRGHRAQPRHAIVAAVRDRAHRLHCTETLRVPAVFPPTRMGWRPAITR